MGRTVARQRQPTQEAVRRPLAMLIALCTLAASGLHAGGPGPDGDWTAYTTADGLPKEMVWAVAVAPDGGVWCVNAPPVEGFHVGVSHLDGGTWSHYTEEDGLAHNFILWTEHTIAVSPSGELWVATFLAGLSRFDGHSWRTYTKDDGLVSNDVAAVAVAPNGDIWVGHPHGTGGVSHYDGRTWTSYPNHMLGQEHGVVALAVGLDGKVWAGFDRGLSCYDGQSWVHYDTPRLVTIEMAPDGTVWAAGDGVTEFRDGNWIHHTMANMGVTEVGEEGVMSLAVGHDGTVWAGTDGAGVFRYDGDKWTSCDFGHVFGGSPALSATVDSEGAVWFGTAYGLFRYLPQSTAVELMSWGQVTRETLR